VLGLGRFGSAVATTLMGRGAEVLAMDSDAERVRLVAEQVTHAVQADATDPLVLRQLGLADFQVAVVGIGSHIEASVLATSAVVDLAVPTVWAKAISAEHGRILERIGAHRIVYPEAEAGERVGHLLSENLLDYIRFDDDFVLVKMTLPHSLVGQSLGGAQLRRRYRVTVVGIKTPGEEFTYASPQTVLAEGSTLAVAGRDADIQRFATRP
jgi:trk system potassium uptake protein TrkA